MSEVFKQIMTTQEAADHLGVKREHVQHLCDRGLLVFEKKGHDYIILRESVVKYGNNRPKRGRKKTP